MRRLRLRFDAERKGNGRGMDTRYVLSCVMGGVAEEALENRIPTIDQTRSSFRWSSLVSRLPVKEQKLSSRKQKKA